MSSIVQRLSRATASEFDPVIYMSIPDAPYSAGSGDGASVSFTISGLTGVPGDVPGASPVGLLPANYAVVGTPSAAALVSISSKSSSGFTVTLTPLSGTLDAGTVDLVVLAA